MLPSLRPAGEFPYDTGSAATIHEDVDASPVELARSIRMMATPAPDSAAYLEEFASLQEAVAQRAPVRPISGAQAYFEKMQNFETSHP